MHSLAQRPAANDDLERSIRRACERIAPTWPLDQFIAVNPYWGFVEQPIDRAAALLGRWSGTRLHMPRAFYGKQWRAGRLRREHLQGAIDAAGSRCTIDELVRCLDEESEPPGRQPLVTDLVDARRDLRHAMPWRDYVTHQVSQCCAAYFDVDQAQWGPDRSPGLYGAWRRQIAADRGPRLLMGYKRLRELARTLPEDPLTLIADGTRALGLDDAGLEPYFTALLLSIQGWASWCAYLRWQARLGGGDDDHIVHLLAIRLAWEWLLKQGGHGHAVDARWAASWSESETGVAEQCRRDERDWLLQSALERSYQADLCRGLANAPAASPQPAPAVQAVFCIDVRSEVFRRALEACSRACQTVGFAGFFGLPIAYQPLGTPLRQPQLPGLLAPAVRVTDVAENPSTTQALALGRGRALRSAQIWRDFRTAASSGFTFVESCGLLYAGKLLKNSVPALAPSRPPAAAGLRKDDTARLRPMLVDLGEPARELDLARRCDLAARTLKAMGLTHAFARLVLFAGHGSQTANNPHAAGLDCGACGGQTGEVNARMLAALLNDGAVRAGIRALGVDVPDDTRFIAGLHDTTTDELRLFDLDAVPTSHAGDVERLQAWLIEAGDRARAERAGLPGAGASPEDRAALKRTVVTRAQDWSEVRPEWGLANNAAFIVAPRARSRHMDLGGRVFLHDYDWRRDDGFATLELIMTAPMIVTNWINLQYYASTVDNPRYGSGNKVLHNVVGGRIGVFEGNGGDLRIGLPLQSLHDGDDWRHTPLRLSVLIEAPQSAVDQVMARHRLVRHLVEHEWLHLFRIDTPTGVLERYSRGHWKPEARS